MKPPFVRNLLFAQIETLFKAVHASAGINQLLLAGVERMALEMCIRDRLPAPTPPFRQSAGRRTGPCRPEAAALQGCTGRWSGRGDVYKRQDQTCHHFGIIQRIRQNVTLCNITSSGHLSSLLHKMISAGLESNKTPVLSREKVTLYE